MLIAVSGLSPVITHTRMPACAMYDVTIRMVAVQKRAYRTEGGDGLWHAALQAVLDARGAHRLHLALNVVGQRGGAPALLVLVGQLLRLLPAAQPRVELLLSEVS